ncbi:MAG: large conductance mechanosensitive channel protein MscL [Ktedonobacterales bacterium]
MKSLFDEFKAFILRGNVVDLAIAVVIGLAFGAVIAALVKDLITPLIAAIGGQPDFSRLAFTINKSTFLYGDFINVVISFLILAAVIFFLVIKPLNYLMSRRKTELPVDPATRDCPFCLSSIPNAATRCAFCTAEVEPLAAVVNTNIKNN